jgi:hypothetical protein
MQVRELTCLRINETGQRGSRQIKCSDGQVINKISGWRRAPRAPGDAEALTAGLSGDRSRWWCDVVQDTARTTGHTLADVE